MKKLTKAQAEVIYRFHTEFGYPVGAMVRLDELFPDSDNRDSSCKRIIRAMAQTGEFIKRERHGASDYYRMTDAALDAFDAWKLPYLLKPPYTIPF